jgi:hypothetical protein
VRQAVIIAVLAACGSSSPGKHAMVTVMAGGQPAAGAVVVSHGVTGAKIDETAADAVGVAQVSIEDGALVTTLFPGQISALTPNIEVVTAPLTDGMTIVGPSDDATPPVIVGGLQIMTKNIQADSFQIQLGCATFTVASMPTVVDVSSRCMGSDTNVDVLVTAYNGGVTVGYAAGRVAMVDGMAAFDPPRWETAYTTLPTTISRSDASVTWSLISDGLAFTTVLGELPTGLMVDRVVVDADIGGLEHTTRWYSSVPAMIALDDSDFLAMLPATLTTGYSWSAAGVGDAVDLRASWDVDGTSGSANAIPPGTHHIEWDAVLPPDATTVGVPPVDLAPPPTAMFALRYVDSSLVSEFPATEIHADTIVPAPADGEIRVTQALGLR